MMISGSVEYLDLPPTQHVFAFSSIDPAKFDRSSTHAWKIQVCSTGRPMELRGTAKHVAHRPSLPPHRPARGSPSSPVHRAPRTSRHVGDRWPGAGVPSDTWTTYQDHTAGVSCQIQSSSGLSSARTPKQDDPGTRSFLGVGGIGETLKS